MKTDLPREVDEGGFLVLPKEFISKGFQFQEVLREGVFAIYSQMREGWMRPVFEVFRIIKRKQYEMGGVVIPAAECVPTSEAWGWLGFSCVTLERAKNRLERLKKENIFSK